MSLSAPSGATCVNHREAGAARKCLKCGRPFCDACLAFSVNGKLWCEPCGNALVDEVRPRWLFGGLVFAAGFVLTSLLWVAKVLFLPVHIPYFRFVMLLGYAGSMYAGWSVVSTTTGTPPVIERRR